MREVSHFVVVFPDRLIRAGEDERELLVDAMRREYPHYKFDIFPGRGFAQEDGFGIIPVVGEVGASFVSEADQVYICKPLDPKVIPDLVKTLQLYETVGAGLN